METSKQASKAVLWTARIIHILCVLFLLLDAVMKVVKAAPSLEGCEKLGWPINAVQAAGLVLLACTGLYSIPKTAVLGAILTTGYLGGATAIMISANQPGHPYIFPIVFGILTWIPLVLVNEKLRAVFPLVTK